MIIDKNFYFQGTVLIKAAEELMNFSKGEEDLLEAVSYGDYFTELDNRLSIDY